MIEAVAIVGFTLAGYFVGRAHEAKKQCDTNGFLLCTMLDARTKLKESEQHAEQWRRHAKRLESEARGRVA